MTDLAIEDGIVKTAVRAEREAICKALCAFCDAGQPVKRVVVTKHGQQQAYWEHDGSVKWCQAERVREDGWMRDQRGSR